MGFQAGLAPNAKLLSEIIKEIFIGLCLPKLFKIQVLKSEKILSTGSDFAQKSGQFHRKIEARLPKFPKFQRFAKFTSNMGPNQFLNFLDLCRPSKAHRLGPKVLPWDQRRYILEYLIMSIRCQNFSSIGPLDQKFGIFSLEALKSTP